MKATHVERPSPGTLEIRQCVADFWKTTVDLVTAVEFERMHSDPISHNNHAR
jgi:hypothetical protein